MTSERLELLAVEQAGDVIWLYSSAEGHCRSCFRGLLLRNSAQPSKGGVNAPDELWQVSGAQVVPRGRISRHDVGGQQAKVRCVVVHPASVEALSAKCTLPPLGGVPVRQVGT
jgi:hypothetical protein